MKCQFFPNFCAEQPENASGASRGQSTHLNMRCLRIGPSPTAGKDPDSGYYTTAEAFEDAKLYYVWYQNFLHLQMCREGLHAYGRDTS